VHGSVDGSHLAPPFWIVGKFHTPFLVRSDYLSSPVIGAVSSHQNLQMLFRILQTEGGIQFLADDLFFVVRCNEKGDRGCEYHPRVSRPSWPETR
jgi:hypothetical protein